MPDTQDKSDVYAALDDGDIDDYLGQILAPVEDDGDTSWFYTAPERSTGISCIGCAE